EAYLLNRAGQAVEVAQGGELDPNTLYLVIRGAFKAGERVVGQGGVIGAGIAFDSASDTGAVAAENSSVFALTKAQLDGLCEAHPRLGIKLYQNLASLRS